MWGVRTLAQLCSVFLLVLMSSLVERSCAGGETKGEGTTTGVEHKLHSPIFIFGSGLECVWLFFVSRIELGWQSKHQCVACGGRCTRNYYLQELLEEEQVGIGTQQILIEEKEKGNPLKGEKVLPRKVSSWIMWFCVRMRDEP